MPPWQAPCSQRPGWHEASGQLGKEALVGFVFGEGFDEGLDVLAGGHAVEVAAETVDFIEGDFADEEFFLAGAGLLNVDGGPDAPVGELTIKDKLHVTGAFEFLEDDFVHAAAGVDQGGGKDGERAAFFGVAGAAEDLFGQLQGTDIDAAAHGAAAGADPTVEGPAKAGDGVEQDDDVVAELHLPFDAFEGKLGDADVTVYVFVVAGSDDFALDLAAHVGDLFGPFVDEQDHELDFGVVGGDAVGNLL